MNLFIFSQCAHYSRTNDIIYVIQAVAILSVICNLSATIVCIRALIYEFESPNPQLFSKPSGRGAIGWNTNEGLWLKLLAKSVLVRPCGTLLCISFPVTLWPFHRHRYWSPIDEMIREAVVLRGVKVRMLISFWKQTHPLTFNFIMSLKSLCMELANCSLEVVSEWKERLWNAY